MLPRLWVPIFLIASHLVSGCAPPPVMLSGVVVQNSTGAVITDVSVRHEPTMRFGRVSMILPDKSFNLGLARQPLVARKAAVDWRDGAGGEYSVMVDLPYAKDFVDSTGEIFLYYGIEPNGVVRVHFQESR